jgi:hypothetical protein
MREWYLPLGEEASLKDSPCDLPVLQPQDPVAQYAQLVRLGVQGLAHKIGSAHRHAQYLSVGHHGVAQGVCQVGCSLRRVCVGGWVVVEHVRLVGRDL